MPASTYGLRASDYWIDGNKLYTNAWWDAMRPRDALGSEVIIKGVSWSGFERKPCLPGGAPNVPLREVARLLHTERLNAVRIPLAVDGVLSERASASSCLAADADLILFNSWLGGSPSFLEMLSRFVRMLGEHGLLVMLDMHAMVAGKWPDDGRVGGKAGGERLKRAWAALADTFCDPETYWNVAAVDLKNEPHGMPRSHARCPADPSAFRARHGTAV